VNGDGVPNEIGRPLLRREDRRHLTGQARFLDDIAIPGALYVKFVRSPHPHARILAIDIAAALAMPGVELVATGADLAGWAMPLHMAPPIEGLQPVTVAPMPVDKARFDGDLARIIHEKCAIKAKPLISLTTMRMGCLMKFFAMKFLAQVFGGLGRFRAVR